MSDTTSSRPKTICFACGRVNDEWANHCQDCGLDLVLQRMSREADVHPPYVTYAGFWRRFVAYLIDGIILSLVDAVLRNAMGWGPGGNVVTMAITWLYFALFESSGYQATPGKMALGLAVTDSACRRLSFGRATGRHFAKILSAVILMIGFLMAAFTEQKRALHDLIADTLVVARS